MFILPWMKLFGIAPNPKVRLTPLRELLTLEPWDVQPWNKPILNFGWLPWSEPWYAFVGCIGKRAGRKEKKGKKKDDFGNNQIG